jgi:hypothetical protein
MPPGFFPGAICSLQGAFRVTPEEINEARSWLSERKADFPHKILDILEAALELALEHTLEKLEYDRHF